MRITLTMWPGGVLRLHHDAGETVTLLLVERDAYGNTYPVGASRPEQAVKAVASNTETTIARVLTTEPIIRLESES